MDLAQAIGVGLDATPFAEHWKLQEAAASHVGPDRLTGGTVLYLFFSEVSGNQVRDGSVHEGFGLDGLEGTEVDEFIVFSIFGGIVFPNPDVGAAVVGKQLVI